MITDELTTFHFRQDGTSWSIPASAETYELLYKQQPISEVETANTPFTFKTADGVYGSIHEAALYDFSEMTLKQIGDYTLKAELGRTVSRYAKATILQLPGVLSRLLRKLSD